LVIYKPITIFCEENISFFIIFIPKEIFSIGNLFGIKIIHIIAKDFQWKVILLKKKNQNDFKRLISSTNVTRDGEIADKTVYGLNSDAIAKEEMYDGFYAVCTNLDEDTEAITKINHRRWEIEECFRIMKSEFKARPVYLSRDDRIEAHFTTCFLALVLYRYLEKYLSEEFTTQEIVTGLRDMNFYSRLPPPQPFGSIQ